MCFSWALGWVTCGSVNSYWALTCSSHGGDLVMQKKGQAVIPNGKSLSVLALALGRGTAERFKPWALESGK